jgi:hypothetical protein
VYSRNLELILFTKNEEIRNQRGKAKTRVACELAHYELYLYLFIFVINSLDRKIYQYLQLTANQAIKNYQISPVDF